MLDDAGDGADDEEDVSEQCDRDRDTHGLVATPPCIGDVRAKQWNDVHPGCIWSMRVTARHARDLPEGVECTQTRGRLLSQAKRARLTVGAGRSGLRTWGKRLLDEVRLG